MYPASAEYTIWDDVTPKAATSSTDASPAVVTSANHGFSTGDKVVIYGHATNSTVNGLREVVALTANTFSLKDAYTGAAVNGAGGGAGSGGVIMPAKVLSCEDYDTVAISVTVPGTPTLTIKFAGSDGKFAADSTNGHGDTPNVGGTQASSNPWTFLDFADTAASGAITDGDTGLVAAGAAVNARVEINASGLKYLVPLLTAYTSGVVSAKARLTRNS